MKLLNTMVGNLLAQHSLHNNYYSQQEDHYKLLFNMKWIKSATIVTIYKSSVTHK